MNNQQLRKAVIDKVLDFAHKDLGIPESQSVIEEAIVLVDYILDAVQQAADSMALKATGNCEHCFGKGYSSYLAPEHVASPDFYGDKRAVVKPRQLEYHFCKCERGQSLKNLILTNAHWVLD